MAESKYRYYDRDKCSSRQFRYLDLIEQYTTGIQLISDKDKVIADALSKGDELLESIDFQAFAHSQSRDEELLLYIAPDSIPKLEQVPIFGTESKICCEVLSSVVHAYLTKPFRRAAFDSLH